MARSASADTLEKFRFLVSWTNSGEDDGTPLARLGFHDAQLPKRATNVIMYREGVDPDISLKSPGLSTFEDVVLGRGLLPFADSGAGREFYQWMTSVHNPTTGLKKRDAADLSRSPDAASNNFRKDVTIKMLDREGAVVRQFTLHQAWPTNFVPGSDLDAGEDGEKSIEQLTLAYEDFTEDTPGQS
jgi:phage tail-like protein